MTPFADAHTGHGTAFGFSAGPQAEPTHLLPPEQQGQTGARPATEGTAVPATTSHGAETIKPTTSEGRAK